MAAEIAADTASATLKFARRIISHTLAALSAVAPATVARAVGAAAYLPAVSTTASATAARTGATAPTAVSAVAPATAARTTRRGWGTSHICFRCGQPGHVLSEYRAVPPTPMNTRLFDPYAGALAATYASSGDYMPTLGADRRHVGLAWIACSVRVFLGLLHRQRYSGVICATSQLECSECMW